MTTKQSIIVYKIKLCINLYLIYVVANDEGSLGNLRKYSWMQR